MRIAGHPIHVLHIIQGKHFGGAEQVVLTLAKSFDPRIVSVSVLCLSDGLLLEKLAAAKVSNYLIKMDSRCDVLLPVWRTARLVRRAGVDIVHTHTVRSNLIGRLAAWLTATPCVTHIHSPILRDFADRKRGQLNERMDALTRPVARRFISVSHSLRNEMIMNGMSARRITSVHNGIDMDSFSERMHQKKAGLRKTLGIKGNDMVVALVALLRPRKGVDVMLKAMARILSQREDIFLIIIGNDDISEIPDYGQQLRDLAKCLGISSHVFFLGFRNDVPSLLTECDLMVLPSLFGEGLPMVIIEAMAAGVPVVASSIEGVPEIIEDSKDGFLVPPADTDALADKILSALDDQQRLENLGMAAKEKVMAGFHCRYQARMIESIYSDIVEG